MLGMDDHTPFLPANLTMAHVAMESDYLNTLVPGILSICVYIPTKTHYFPLEILGDGHGHKTGYSRSVPLVIRPMIV